MKTQSATPVVASSFPVFGLLGAVLVVLKVLGKIGLAWKWVLAPFWVPAVFGFGVLGIVLVFALIAALIGLD